MNHRFSVQSLRRRAAAAGTTDAQIDTRSWPQPSHVFPARSQEILLSCRANECGRFVIGKFLGACTSGSQVLNLCENPTVH